MRRRASDAWTWVDFLAALALECAPKAVEQIGEGLREAAKARREAQGKLTPSAVWAERARTGRWDKDDAEDA